MKKNKRDTAYKLIPLTRGLVAAVSPEDYDEVSKVTWAALIVEGPKLHRHRR